MALLIGVAIIALAIAGCGQFLTKEFGGTSSIDLPKGQKLVIATWKESNLWYLVRPMRLGEVPETHEFVESSLVGVLQGKVIFREH
ncbi:MAG: hypothetical protein V1690_02020 [Candidatus Moraniibacteriota bacterium]